MVGACQGGHAAADGREVDGRHLPLAAWGSDAVDAAHVDVAHAVAPHAGVVPVGHDQRAIRRHAHVAWPKPAVSLAVGNRGDLSGVARGLRLHHIAPHDVGAGVAVDDGMLKTLREQVALIETDAGGRSASGLEEVGHHAGIVEMPVLQRNVLLKVGPRRPPAGARSLVDVAVVAKLKHRIDPHAAVAVVVVVALPERAEGVDRHLVVVAEVVAEHLKVGAVGPAAKDHALAIRAAGIVNGVAKAVDDRRAVGITHPVASVAEVEIPAAVGADDEGVHGVVVLRIAGVGEERLFAIGNKVAIVVVKHEHIRRARHDHLPAWPLAKHADA